MNNFKLYMSNISFFLVFLFFSYELINFNEEFFIALGFICFFFFISPLVSAFVGDFFKEDRLKFFNFLKEDLYYSNNFYKFFLEFFQNYESACEFFYQNLTFYNNYLVQKFFDFYTNFSAYDIEDVEENLPETLSIFYERIIDFLFLKIQAKYQDYFLNKWENFLSIAVIENISESNEGIPFESSYEIKQLEEESFPI